MWAFVAAYVLLDHCLFSQLGIIVAGLILHFLDCCPNLLDQLQFLVLDEISLSMVICLSSFSFFLFFSLLLLRDESLQIYKFQLLNFATNTSTAVDIYTKIFITHILLENTHHI